MKKVGVVIDSWKLPIFKRQLDAAGFSYTEHPGITADTLLLKVKTDLIGSLQPIVEKANAECAARKVSI